MTEMPVTEMPVTEARSAVAGPTFHSASGNGELLARLLEVLGSTRPAAVAVSGGVDSMTLAFLAHRVLGPDVTMFHAGSAAVPTAATRRVRAHAARHGWDLRIVDAGEFDDERYLANPANRCYFCKSDLYGTLRSFTDAQLYSGTNTEDLDDWRPGLQAAANNQVRHPFVEVGMSKADIRAVAAAADLTDLAELPAAPCLSSRIETDLRIVPRTLRAVDRAEELVRSAVAPSTVRCRVRRSGVVVELDPETLTGLDDARRRSLAERVGELFGDDPQVEFRSYVRGSAFLRNEP